MAAAPNAARMNARRPVPIGCTGARRERRYCPARLWLAVVPACDPDCGFPRYFIITIFRGIASSLVVIDYASTTPHPRKCHERCSMSNNVSWSQHCVKSLLMFEYHKLLVSSGQFVWPATMSVFPGTRICAVIAPHMASLRACQSYPTRRTLTPPS